MSGAAQPKPVSSGAMRSPQTGKDKMHISGKTGIGKGMGKGSGQRPAEQSKSGKGKYSTTTTSYMPVSSGIAGSIEEEIRNNPDVVNDPDELRRLLSIKIGKLGDTIRQVQNQNFVIEDDVIERLRLLKGFNDQMEKVNN